MALRITRQRMRYTAWAVTALLIVVAVWSGHLRAWLLPLLFWAYYELCLCPTICGVRTRSGGLCRNPASGRLYACQAQPSHSRLKTDALLRLVDVRRGAKAPPRADEPRQRTAAADFGPETVTIDARQKRAVLLIVLGTLVAVVLALVL